MLTFENKKVIVVAPHLDDIELGLGATLSKIINSKGAVVHYVGLSIPPLVDHDSFMEEFWESSRYFKIPKENYHLFNFDPRNLFDVRMEILQLLYDLGKNIQPDIVFIPNSKDIHQSHQVVYSEATRAFKYCSILGYELPWNSMSFNMDVFIKVSEENISDKVNAVNSFKTQMKRMFFANNIVLDLARVRGKQIGGQYAECFELIRMISE
jgi:LmbE family N-acetylglucosaminyl deacetylase